MQSRTRWAGRHYEHGHHAGAALSLPTKQATVAHAGAGSSATTPSSLPAVPLHRRQVKQPHRAQSGRRHFENLGRAGPAWESNKAKASDAYGPCAPMCARFRPRLLHFKRALLNPPECVRLPTSGRYRPCLEAASVCVVPCRHPWRRGRALSRLHRRRLSQGAFEVPKLPKAALAGCRPVCSGPWWSGFLTAIAANIFLQFHSVVAQGGGSNSSRNSSSSSSSSNSSIGSGTGSSSRSRTFAWVHANCGCWGLARPCKPARLGAHQRRTEVTTPALAIRLCQAEGRERCFVGSRCRPKPPALAHATRSVLEPCPAEHQFVNLRRSRRGTAPDPECG